MHEIENQLAKLLKSLAPTLGQSKAMQNILQHLLLVNSRSIQGCTNDELVRTILFFCFVLFCFFLFCFVFFCFVLFFFVLFCFFLFCFVLFCFLTFFSFLYLFIMMSQMGQNFGCSNEDMHTALSKLEEIKLVSQNHQQLWQLNL